MDRNAPGEATRLLADVGRGDRAAIEKFMPIVYQELRELAAACMRNERANHTLQPTALVHEALLRLIGPGGPQCNDRRHFLALAAQVMRRILVNHAVALRAEKRNPGRPTVQLDNSEAMIAGREVDTIALDDALSALATLDARKAQVVELRFFGGMTVQEVAEQVGVSVSTVQGDWRMARAWLSQRLSNN